MVAYDAQLTKTLAGVRIKKAQFTCGCLVSLLFTAFPLLETAADEANSRYSHSRELFSSLCDQFVALKRSA